MIRTHRLVDGGVVTEYGAGSVRMPRGDERVWFMVVAPDAVEQKTLADLLPLHELAMEDALNPGHPPKIEDFEDHLFWIAHSPQMDDDGTTRKVAVFLGKTWVVSVFRAELVCADEVESRVLKEPVRFLGAPERIGHALLDHTMDAFERRVDDEIDECERLEGAAIEAARPEVLVDILSLRSDVSYLLRTMRSQRDVCLSLSRTEHRVLSKKILPYFRDAYDHCLRIYDLLEGVREGVGGARDAYFSSQNTRLSETMRILTVIATIMMPLGVVAGIFGMNFDAIPGLHDPLGFWTTLLGMLGLSSLMLLWFRRRGWL